VRTYQSHLNFVLCLLWVRIFIICLSSKQSGLIEFRKHMRRSPSLRDRRRILNKARDTYCPLVSTLSLSHGYCTPFYFIFFYLRSTGTTDRIMMHVVKCQTESVFFTTPRACADHREFLATAFPSKEYEAKEIKHRPFDNVSKLFSSSSFFIRRYM